MIPIVVFAIGVALLAGYEEGDFVFGAILLPLGALLGALAALVIGAIFYSGTHIVAHAPIQLESLVDGSELHGNFFLGSGAINNVATYTWYEQTKENSFEQRHANAADSTIHFLPSKPKTPPYYVARYAAYGKGPWLDTWGFRVMSGEEKQGAYYDFYVPRGTITRNFELDSK